MPEQEHAGGCHTGGCLCGAIRYRVIGAPTGANTCHCTQCQHQTGAPFAAFVHYPLDRFSLIAGEPATFRSSDAAARQFCSRCGSILFWRGDDTGKIDIFTGTLDDPAAMPPPTYQLWAKRRLPWVPEMPEIPAYPTSRSASESNG